MSMFTPLVVRDMLQRRDHEAAKKIACYIYYKLRGKTLRQSIKCYFLPSSVHDIRIPVNILKRNRGIEVERDKQVLIGKLCFKSL